ncbi:hypothetical protein K2173_015128 [Erythroxylum novogranatense]|uniref:Cycloidea-like protein n=1 Tax=Erythroxylum novogranatense TaxID=1862640 RepID=A0AAV8T128_9ROSI|nr:hypothetical protein K2173_015128 [Erythroxylum novogranatense]
MSGSSLTTGAPNPIPADHPSPFLEFSSFFLNGYDPLVCEFISQQQQQRQQAFAFKDDSVVESPEINPEDSREGPSIDNKKRNKANAVKNPRRTGKKDRHSKIYTAQGPRDRRMRLSLQIARKFFDLQDMLGFDKASKTIDWLFMKSKSAIKELTDNLPRLKRSNRLTDNCVSSTSESEHLSNPIEQKSKKPHKTALNPLARESRDKARARARERTRERMKIKAPEKAKPLSQANPNNLKQREPKSPKTNDQSLSIGSQELNSFKDVVGEEVPITDLLQHQMDSESISNKITGVIREPRSSLIFDFSHSIANTGTPNIEEITDTSSQKSTFMGTLKVVCQEKLKICSIWLEAFGCLHLLHILHLI